MSNKIIKKIKNNTNNINNTNNDLIVIPNMTYKNQFNNIKNINISKKKMINWFLTEIDDKTILFDHLLISFETCILSKLPNNLSFNKQIMFTQYCNWIYSNTI